MFSMQETQNPKIEVLASSTLRRQPFSETHFQAFKATRKVNKLFIFLRYLSKE